MNQRQLNRREFDFNVKMISPIPAYLNIFYSKNFYTYTYLSSAKIKCQQKIYEWNDSYLQLKANIDKPDYANFV